MTRQFDPAASATVTTTLSQHSAPTSRESGMFETFLGPCRIMARCPPQEDVTHVHNAPSLLADDYGHDRFLMDWSLCMAGLQSCPLVTRLDSGVEICREIELLSITVESNVCSSDQPKRRGTLVVLSDRLP